MIFRTISILLIGSLFILALANTYNWGWIALEVLGFELICYLIIAVDEAKEYKP